jgi:hypothetical protein
VKDAALPGFHTEGPEEKTAGVKIASQVLGEDIWLVVDPDFKPDDGLACYYPEELEVLKTKSPEDLREIQKCKLAFPGSKVIGKSRMGLLKKSVSQQQMKKGGTA